ncbi:hypothetical protein F2P56_024251 [Juglans regia]|uniref:La-related protein 1C-like n=2 Tax=Juglans regia TaxID=51240 RepID=A0A2I4FDA4_JUGRE|nr:la-related protein 1C-like [Juglans regia]KAF5454599.1 hypothetical protein F2P56_024251 [Juglans regia]
MATSSSANADSASATNQSPRHSTVGADTVGSPQSRRATRVVSSSLPPWTQIVRGQSEPVAAAPSSPSHTTAVTEPAVALVVVEESMGEGSENGPNGNAGKRPAWNKPSNGPAPDVGAVMGAASWPALSVSTRASAKPSSESSKCLSDIVSPVAPSQGTGTTSSSSQKQVSNNANSNPTSNHSINTRQRSMKRHGVSTSSNGGLPPQQQAPPGAVIDGGLNNPSPKDHMQRSGFSSQSHSGNDHPPQRNSFRNRNGGSHTRGDGSHHHNYKGRHDHERGNSDWNAHRNFAGKDTHMQPQRVIHRFMRGPPSPQSSAPFIPPPTVRPYGGPIGFPDMPPPMVYVAAPSPESLRGMPFVAPIPPHALFFHASDPQLYTKIVNQIDYYFSNENLVKDIYLRQNMDDQGWVPIKLIAGFKKVMLLTENIQLILDAVRTSNVLEIQGDKVRRRNDWMKWIISPSVHFPEASGQQSSGKSSQDILAAHVQSMALEEKTTDHSSAGGQADVHGVAIHSGLPSGDSSSLMQLSGGRITGVGVQAGSDHSISA